MSRRWRSVVRKVGGTAMVGLGISITAPATAGLVGVSSATSSYYEIDPATATPTLISVSDRTISYNDIAFLHGQAYVTDLRNGTTYSTYKVDLPTGKSTFLR